MHIIILPNHSVAFINVKILLLWKTATATIRKAAGMADMGRKAATAGNNRTIQVLNNHGNTRVRVI